MSTDSIYWDRPPPVRYLSPRQRDEIKEQQERRIVQNEADRRRDAKAIMDRRRHRFRMRVHKVCRELMKRQEAPSSADHLEILTKEKLEAILRNLRQ